ncbi:helix-turn-helix domain-containing protein [Streptomyces sp. XH2]|uniref:helix-turn-helix domain-containing protein n=1 Tax=Streptomyces sp. XH2 TaxID=3412483 RepID=UPI003C7C8D37
MAKTPRTPDEVTHSRHVGQNVRRLRTESGWTQSDLAVRTLTASHPLGLNQISAIERGYSTHSTALRSVSVDELLTLATALRVTPATLLGEPGCPTCEDSPPRGFTCNTCGKDRPVHS